MSGQISAAEFASKWRNSERRERASAQEHFIDLCRLVGAPTPAEAEPGSGYRFEQPARRASTGGTGWADVWKRGHFVWEYKGADADLAAAYQQALDYEDALEHPPLLVVSDMDRIEVRTRFTARPTTVHPLTLDDLAAGGERTAEALRILTAVMLEPDALRPRQTPAEVTQQAARGFAELARSMQARGHEPEPVAHFLNRVLFCLFAEDVGLLPKQLITNMIAARREPAAFTAGLREIFRLMSNRDAGRYFGNDEIAWFNGGLFDGDDALDFTRDELQIVAKAATLDWSQVEPAILGTLFERGLDPDKRGQLGAHYTDREKILMVVEPVVLTPLRREFAAMQAQVEALIQDHEPRPLTRAGQRRANLPQWEQQAETAWRGFLERLRGVRVLDPACGSGNFLYVTLRLLKDLEQETIRWGAERLRISGEFPQVAPHNVLGIEINPYAKELAAVAIWIGHIQWMRDHGYGYPKDPVLQPLDNIELRDAILACEDGKPVPAKWPAAEFVVGNPPFLGMGMRLRAALGDDYVEALFTVWGDSVTSAADLCCYWHEQARRQIAAGATARAGLLATNSIRDGAGRRTLERISESGAIFMAWSDEPWTVEGAAVRVSIVAQDDGTESERLLNDIPVSAINSDLTEGIDLTKAKRLLENSGISYKGVSKGGDFDIPGDVARAMLTEPTNVNGRSNVDVVVPLVSGMDIVRRQRDRFLIDFGVELTTEDASEYEVPFSHVEEHVQAARASNRSKQAQKFWWRHERPRPEMRRKLILLSRYIATTQTAKHRIFTWLSPPALPDSLVIVIAREDDYAFGVLHSRPHELWSLRMGTSLEDRPRYTPTTTFETFPFPWPLNTPDAALTDVQQRQRDAIAAAARELDAKRRHWLNPPEWVREVPDVVPSLPMRLLPVDDQAAQQLKQRTLTKLYNERPTWLGNLHAKLDEAVLNAYGWPANISDDDLLARLLALNLARAAGQ